jgi:hypothetical protein
MKNLLKEARKIKIIINPRLNDIDVTTLFPESLAEANRVLKNLRMPDMYYQQMIDKYNSQKLRDALKENQPGNVLNEIVRALAAEHSESNKQ